MLRKIFLTLTAVAMLTGLSASILAQSKKSSGNSKGRFEELVKAAREGKAQTNPEIAEKIRAAYREEKTENLLAFGSIVGTWNVTVPTPDGDFYALHTFNLDGTFTETSSLLATLAEGPAHGVWEHRRRGIVLTFELFAFDGDGAVVGRFRVRNLIELTDSDHFTALSTFDFIDLDGTVTPDLGGGEYTAERMQVRGL